MKDTPALGGPQPTKAHRNLDVFIGQWHAVGQSYADGQRVDNPKASAVQWRSEETYEWLPGSFFMLHRWHAMMGKRVFKGAEIVGYDQAKGGYFSHLFDNAGNHADYHATVDGNVWTFSEAQTRATVTVHGLGERMTFIWEWKNGGSDWLPLCERIATRQPEVEDRMPDQARESVLRYAGTPSMIRR